MSVPLNHVRIVEVGPRDGLQNEANFVPTPVKVAFVDMLSDAGLEEVEVSSFVSPRWVPQLADAAEVFRSIRRRKGTVYSALVPNERGLDQAIEARVDKICVFTAASETFSIKNVNATIAQSLTRIAAAVRRSPVPVRGYVSTAFHCPYEGPVSAERAVSVAEELLQMGCSELSIGDTIGTATVPEVERLIAQLLARVPVQRVAMHFHDTFGRAIANVAASAVAGIGIFDGSVGGIGGCPYAPGASGNVGTEALAAHFGARTGIDPLALGRASALVRPYLSGDAALAGPISPGD